MATARKLPSGSWRVQVFSHYEIKDGKKVRRYRSFTSSDKSRAGKKEAERMASEWAYRREERAHGVSVLDAVGIYISTRKGVLSPSSVRAYTSYKKHHLSDIGLMRVNELDQGRLQEWVSSLSRELKPKTVKEIVSLVNSAIKMQLGRGVELTLPQPSQKKQHTPTDDEITALLDSVSEDMRICILLSAFCSLRRGEICALRDTDFHDNMVTVSKSMVRDVSGDWIIKEPKTPGSVRSVPVPDKLMDMIKNRKGKIVPYVPDQLTKKFRKAVHEQYRFHDLRHYYASTAHYLGIPDAYIMKNGGWSTDSVMKRVYREALADKIKEENDKMAEHFRVILRDA